MKRKNKLKKQEERDRKYWLEQLISLREEILGSQDK